jgi:hypothetical protein
VCHSKNEENAYHGTVDGSKESNIRYIHSAHHAISFANKNIIFFGHSVQRHRAFG